MGNAKKSAVDPSALDPSPPELDPALLIEVCAQLLAIRTLDGLIASGCAGLRYSDGFVFQHLVPGPLPVTDLAKRLKVTQQGASKTVVDLERRGYVERVQAQHDDRVRLVTLTDLGWKAVHGARHAREALTKDLRSMLGVEAAEEFSRSLRTLTERLGGFDALRERRLLPR
jgi:DNA-binding MarR family transcriptional regulator